jgi:quinol-cytochrome oxidoreductase complex cytochrome b subunit
MTDSDNDSIPFYPEHVRSEFKVVVGILVIAVVLGAVGMFFPVGIGDLADPLNTPTHVKPEWYFLSLYQLLKYISKTAGTVLPLLAVALVMVWPFLQRRVDTSRRSVKRRLIFVAITVVVFVGLTIWGEVG